MTTAAVSKRIEQVEPGDHLCLGFRTDRERQDVIAVFVREGLRRAEKVTYLAEDPDTVLRWLPDYGVDPGPHLASGQLAVVGAGNACLTSLAPDQVAASLARAIADARAQGYSGFRVTGEMSRLSRGRPETDRLLSCERLLTAVVEQTRTMALCQYDTGRFAPAEAHALAGAHRATVVTHAEYDDGILRITRTNDPPGLRLTGEVDRRAVPVLAQALASAARGGRDVSLDLSAVRFIDVAGADLLVRTAMRLHPQRRLLLDHPPHALRCMIRLLWGQLPGMRI